MIFAIVLRTGTPAASAARWMLHRFEFPEASRLGMSAVVVIAGGLAASALPAFCVGVPLPHPAAPR